MYNVLLCFYYVDGNSVCGWEVDTGVATTTNIKCWRNNSGIGVGYQVYNDDSVVKKYKCKEMSKEKLKCLKYLP